jgi:DNA-binding MarR family transcriptional regulator
MAGDELRPLLQAFIRRFGLLSPDRTPCGKDLPPSDAHALMILRAAGEDGLPQAALAARLGVDKSTASRVVGRLLDAERAERAPSSADAREKPVRLTARGMKLARELDAASAERFATLLAHVPRRRRADVVDAVRELVAALERMTTDPEPPP